MAELPIGYEFWRHRSSGQVFAVKLDGKRVVAVAGPVDWKQASYSTLETAEYTTEQVDWIDHDRGSFALHPVVAGPDS